MASGLMIAPTCLPLTVGNGALVCISAGLSRFALAQVKSDTDATAIRELAEPMVLPLLPCTSGRSLVRFGTGFGLCLGSPLDRWRQPLGWLLDITLRLVMHTGSGSQGCVEHLPAIGDL